MSTVYLNGVNINKYVVEGSLNIDDAIGERSTCQFDIRCPAGALNLVVGARVEVYTDNIKVFGGTIDNIDKIELLGTNPRYLQFSVQCSDWHQICDRRIVSEAYENMAAGDIVQSLIQNYLASEGIIGNPADPSFTRSSIAYLSDGTQVAANQPRFEQGRFGKAIMVEEGTTNLLQNPSFETGDLSNWSTGFGSGITGNANIVTNPTWHGNYAVKITITDSTSTSDASVKQNINVASGVTVTLSAYLLELQGNVNAELGFRCNNGSGGYQFLRKVFTTPGYCVYTATIPDGYIADQVWLTIRPRSVGGIGYGIFDAIQLEQKPYATSFIDGTRAAETLTIPTVGVLNPQEGTVECWVYFDANSLASNKETFWIIGTAKTKYADRIILQRLGSNLRFQVSNGTTTTTISFPLSNINIGWHYLAARWSTSEVSLFLDGTKIATASNPNLPQSLAANCGIGYNIVSGAEQCNTLIDDLRISSIARSDEEILAAYQSGQPLPVDEWTTYKLDFDDNINNSAISIQNGPIVQQAVFNYVSATQCLDKLADLAGFTWWIDSSKRLHFCDRALYQAPFDIDEQSKIMRPKLSCNRDNYRNRQYIRAGKGTTDPQTEIFKGNGVQKTFTVGFPIAKVPTIKVNGVTQTVGIKGVDTGKDWYWNKGDAVITQDEEATPLSETDTLQITYQGFYDIIVLTDDYSAVLERQSVEGGTGLYEAVNEEPYAETSEAAFQSANALLKKYAKLGQVLSFDTLLTGFRAGQLLQVNLPVLGAVGEYLIRKVQYRDMPGDKYDYLFSVEAVSCFAAETWTKFFKSNLGQPKTYVIRENIQEQEVLIRLVQQSEHTSWTEEVVQTVLACPVPSENLYPSDTLYPC